MSQPINYEDWFYKYHKYIKGNRDGLITYNDTKWKTINDRILPLVEAQSRLIEDQPFAVVGNSYGIDKLMNLMQDSNYTFDDINDALVETYKFNYKNAMSRMLVNTHAVICSFSNRDNKNVSYDSASNYYIIDVPYDQMHFGERDEFIRQRLHDMHVKSTNKWIHIKDLNSIPIYKNLLDFSILISMNGLICNDCMVAFDDKGMMFKVRWKYSTYFDCIVYKLDTSNIYTFDIDSTKLNSASIFIPWSDTGYDNFSGTKLSGLIDIYYNEYTSTLNVPVNFCYMDSEGIHIPNLQSATGRMLHQYSKISMIHITIYELKYFFEIPNVYPAVNYFNILNKNLVKTNDDHGVVVDGDTVFTSNDKVDYTTTVGTPPIVIDRDNTQSHKTILTAFHDINIMTSLNSTLQSIGSSLQQINDNTSASYISTNITEPIESVYQTIESCRFDYLKFATLTSMVEQSNIRLFDKIFDDVSRVYESRTNVSVLKSLRPDMFYGTTYAAAVKSIYDIFNNEIFSTVVMMNSTINNFITPADATRFTRPVSEQCFIVLKYDSDDDVWLFDYPDIKHFNGIQNAFYIDSHLTGKELFKFFVLYTDTEASGDKNIEPLSESNVFDFDKFCDEIHKHQAYLRYWSVENKLLKMSKVLFNQYDGTTCVGVMSKMLKHKIGDQMVEQYPSDINYEASGISTLGVGNDDSLEAPFTINYLFYTINRFYNENDAFLSYFIYRLTHDKYYDRYIDLDISSVLNYNDSINVNYSYFWTAPNTILTSTSALRTGDHVYNGLPFIVNGNGSVINTPYKYSFNDYGFNNTEHYELIDNNAVDSEFYISYIDPTSQGATPNIYNKDIEAVRILTHYMSTVHDNISSLMTDYKTSFNQMKLLKIFRKRLADYKSKFEPLLELQYAHPDMTTLLNPLFGDGYSNTNHIVYNVDLLYMKLDNMINRVVVDTRVMSIYSFIQEFVGLVKRIYLNYGFKDFATPNARRLYMHLRKINYTMNLYELKEWFKNIDYAFIENINNYVANNTLYTNINFNTYINVFHQFEDTMTQTIDDIKSTMIQLDNDYRLQFTRIRGLVEDIIENYIFNMYRMNIKFTNRTFSSKPLYAKVTLPSSPHITHPVTHVSENNVDIVLYPKYERSNNEYRLVSLYPICEYTFFDDEPITTDVIVTTESGDITVDATLEFKKVGSSADIVDTIQLLNGLNDTKVDIQNIHETMSVVNNIVVNKKYADMHYELLIGNKFNQLSHNSELVLDRTSLLPGSIDRIYVPNQMINDYTLESWGNHDSSGMYFKPSQVLHIEPVDGAIQSVYGPYAVGQRIYLETPDDYRFPITITQIDHSQARGFVEAVVDYSAEWFKLDDIERIRDYLNNPIECTIIPDNVSNFLNEYNNPSLGSYDIIDMYDIPQDEWFYFPGDPIFVQNNANYVYTRLNWMIDENVENRFIDDEHKQYQFKYIGEYQIYETDIDQMPVLDGVDHYYDSLRYMTPTEWFDFYHDKSLPITLNSIGDEHELIMNIHGTHRDTNVIRMTGPDVEYSMDNHTIYIVFKRIDGVPLPVEERGYALPSSIIGTSISIHPSDPVFMIGVYNQDDTNFNKLMFYGGDSTTADPWAHSIISDVDASEYHVVCLTYRHDETENTRYATLYIDGNKIDSIEHDGPFINWLGLGQLVTSGYGDQYVIFGDTGKLCVKFISTINGVHSDEDIQSNSEWLYDRYIDPLTKITTPFYDSFRINMINHNVDPLTLSQIYPILRTEPDDHDVWDGEIATFESRIEVANVSITRLEGLIISYTREMEKATTRYDIDYYRRKIEDCNQKIKYWESYIERMKYYIRNLEKPSTWYNIGSYDAALVYIDNGRAERVSNSMVEWITDFPYTDDVELYMYDYQNHVWVDPSQYVITPHVVNGVRFDNPDDYSTNNVLHSIEVQLMDAHVTQKLMVYIGFNKSDIFQSIEHNPPTCQVQFKPLLSVNHNIDTDVYSEINVRKHFDGYEYYKYTEDNLPNDIDRADILEGFMVERPTPNGKYTNNPVYRFRDIEINNKPYTAFDFYIPMKFKNIDTTELSDSNKYTCIVNVPVDSYQKNTMMTLICVESDKYNGNVSTLSFTVKSGSDDTQSFTVLKSSNIHLDAGSYICTVSQSSSAYKSCGGLITVIVEKVSMDELKCGNWVRLNDPKYHIIPERFVVSCPSEGGFPYNVIIKNRYYNDQGKWLAPDNSDEDDPYQYYFNSDQHVRYPLSDTRHSDPTTRLAINTNINPNIELVKAPYIGICRYSLNEIPSDGIIDMTGHIPTPLTRDRYEFWVNGRCIKDDKSLTILSPTSIQLCNLNSLHNFECVELVDDVYDSDILPHGNVYIDLYGNYYHTNTYESFLQMMMNNRYVVEQRIDYMFYNLQHDQLFEYTGCVNKHPNNHDIEPNILDGLKLSETSNYREMIHLPTINGVTLYNPSVKDLGLYEINNNDILDLYDKIWKHESIVNPYIPLHHKSDIMNIPVIKYDKDPENDCYFIEVTGQYDGFFTIYISSSNVANIDDTSNTIQIIPFVSCGVSIRLDGIDKYKKKYVHTTTQSTPTKLN